MPRTYALLCGNFDCPSRQMGHLFQVLAEDVPDDGEVWVCPECYRKQKAS